MKVAPPLTGIEVLDRSFFNVSIVRAPLHEVALAFDGYTPMRVKTAITPFILPTQPYGEAEIPMLLWAPKVAPELTVFMPSVSSGDYFFTQYCAQFKFDVIEFRTTTSKAKHQVNEFSAYSAGKKIRVVQSLQDSPRWVFFERGEPLPFELLEKYQSKFIRDRLTRDTILSYAKAWGAPLCQPDFWITEMPALTFEKKRENS